MTFFSLEKKRESVVNESKNNLFPYMGNCVWSRPELWSSTLPASHRKLRWCILAVGPVLPVRSQTDWSQCPSPHRTAIYNHPELTAKTKPSNTFILINISFNLNSTWVFLQQIMILATFTLHLNVDQIMFL